MKPNIDMLIEDLVATALGNRTAREQFLFRQSLHNLVRLAKAEQMLEIKSSMTKLSGAAGARQNARQARVDGL
jgi:hypothetical protein